MAETDIVDWLRHFKTLLIKSDASKPEGVAVARIAEAASEIERLRRSIQGSAGEGWQPIDSAPKDGTTAEFERRHCAALKAAREIDLSAKYAARALTQSEERALLVARAYLDLRAVPSQEGASDTEEQDIVERLRSTAKHRRGSEPVAELLKDAADAIWRLRHDLDEARAGAQVEEMARALIGADGYFEADDTEERDDPGNIRRDLRAMIRAALSSHRANTEEQATRR